MLFSSQRRRPKRGIADDEADAAGGGAAVAAPKKQTRKVVNGKSIRLKQGPTFVNDSENSADSHGNVLVNFLGKSVGKNQP